MRSVALVNGQWMTPEQFEKWWPTVVRLSGLILIFYEAVVEKADRPSLIVAAIGMIGFTWVAKLLKKD